MLVVTVDENVEYIHIYTYRRHAGLCAKIAGTTWFEFLRDRDFFRSVPTLMPRVFFEFYRGWSWGIYENTVMENGKKTPSYIYRKTKYLIPIFKYKVYIPTPVFGVWILAGSEFFCWEFNCSGFHHTHVLSSWGQIRSYQICCDPVVTNTRKNWWYLPT